MDGTIRADITQGSHVAIVLKKDQKSGKLTTRRFMESKEGKMFVTMKLWWKTKYMAKLEATKREMSLVEFIDRAVRRELRAPQGGE